MAFNRLCGCPKNQCDHRTLRAIAPECVPSDESMKIDTKEEDEDEKNLDNNCSISRRKNKKRPGNKHSSDEVANFRNKHEVLKIDSDYYQEEEKK